MSTLWGVYGVKPGSGNPFAVSGRVSLDDNMVVVKEKTDGTGGVRLLAVLNSDKQFGFASQEINRVLDITGTIGASVAGISGASVVLYLVKLGLVGRAAGSVHMALTVAKGMIYPVSISARHNQYATVSVMVRALSSDGETSPVAENATAAIPSMVSPTKAFTLGPAYINGTRRDGLSDMTVNFGQGVDIAPYDGQPYPQIGHLDEGEPTIDLEVSDAGTVAALLANGALGGSGNTDYYLRAVQNLNKQYAENATEHIRLRQAAGVFVRNGVGGERLASTRLQAHLAKTGDTQMLQYATGVAIG